MKNTVNQIDKIRTRKDLVDFLHEFSREFRQSPETWENKRLETFLAALAAWAGDMDGFYLNQGKAIPETPEWKTFAEMLIAATMYE